MNRAFRVSAAISALLLPGAASATILQNGSLENPDGTWVNTTSNYMAVPTASAALTGWSVVNAGGRGIAWAKAPTGDGYNASNGSYFVDLSGFGVEAGAASIEQTLQNLVVGELYTLSFDYLGSGPDVLLAGNLFVASSTLVTSQGWTSVSRQFTATAGSELIQFRNFYTSSPLVFLDNINVSGKEATTSVPEPASWTLFGLALGIAGFACGNRRRVRE